MTQMISNVPGALMAFGGGPLQKLSKLLVVWGLAVMGPGVW